MKQNSMDSRSPDSVKVSKLRFRAKLLWISQTRTSFSIFQACLLLLISCLQIFFITTRFIREYLIQDPSSLGQGIKHLEDIITFDNLFEYSDHDLGLLAAFAIIIAYFVIFLGTFASLVRSAKSSQPSIGPVIKILPFLLRFHGPVFFFVINNLCSRVQEEYIQKDFSTFNSKVPNQVLFFLTLAITVINLTVAVFIDIFFSDSLPSKNPLSSKNSYIDQITIYQKAVFALLWRFLPQGLLTKWFITLLNLSLSLIKQYFYYHTLPRYNVQTLKYNACMLTLEASIILLTPLIFVLDGVDAIEISVTSTIMIIVLLLPLMIVCTREIVNNILIEVMFGSPHHLNLQKLIHKLVIFKHLKGNKDHPGKEKSHFNINKLYFNAFARNRKFILNEEDKDLLFKDFTHKEVKNKSLRHYLEKIDKHHPNNNLLKLTLTRFYTQKLKLFPLAIATLAKVKSFSPRIRVSVDLLSLEIQEAILKLDKNEQSFLDLSEYLPTMNQAESFEEKIKTQLDFHQQFWSEYNKNIPDIYQLNLIAEKIIKQKKLIQIQWNTTKFNKSYSQPFLLYAYYLFTLNDSPREARRCINNYNLLSRTDKEDNDPLNFTISTLYSESTFYVTIRTDTKFVGTISKCSQSIQKTLNYDSKTMIGTNINRMISDYMGRDHNRFVTQYIKTGEYKILNKMRREFVKDNSGFLHKTWLYAKIQPFFDQEIFLTAIMKPIETFEEYILITPQGQIDSASKGIAKKLGIVGKKVPIVSICEDFQEINEAFNYFGYRELLSRLEGQQSAAKSLEALIKTIKLDENELEKIYKKWYLEGDNLTFFGSSKLLKHSTTLSPTTTNKTVKCLCQIHNFYFSSDFMKVVTIHKVNHAKKEGFTLKTLKSKNFSNQFEKSSKIDIGIIPISPDASSADFAGIAEKDEVKPEGQLQINQANSPYSSQSQNFLVLSSTKYLDLKPFDNSKRDSVLFDKFSSSNLEGMSNSKKPEVKKANAKKLVEPTVPIPQNSVTGSSYASNKTRRDRIYSDILEALNIKIYTRNSYILLFLCFCFGATLFGTQISLHYKIGSDLDDLEALGNTLDLANTGVDALIFLSRGARLIFLNQLELIDGQMSPVVHQYMKTFENALKIYLPILKDSNNNLWSALQKIDENFRKEFLHIDIEFFDINQNLTIEATRLVNILMGNTALENILYHIQTQHAETDEYYPIDLVYVMRNACGGLAVKTKNIAEMVLKYIEVAITNQHTSLDIYFGLGALLILIGLSIVLFFGYRFYLIEANRMHSYIQISEQEVNSIKENLSLFEQNLKSQEYNNIGQTQQISLSFHQEKSKAAAKQIYRKTSRTPNMKDFKKRYWLKVLTWVAILACYLVYMTTIYRKAYENGSNFKSGTNRLLTTQRFLEYIQLSVVGFYAIFIPDYEPLVEEQPTLDVLRTSLKTLSGSTTDLTNAYKLSDSTIDPSITAIFNGDICDFVPASDSGCSLVTAGSRDLFSFITALYTDISYKVDEYLLSDKSPEVVRSIVTIGFLEITPIVTSLRNVLLYMISQARVNFFQVHQTLIDQLTIYLVVDIVLFIILVVLSWIFVMRYLMDYNNRIKRMLTVIPINILITNRSMKPLLKRSCKGMFGAIKEEF